MVLVKIGLPIYIYMICCLHPWDRVENRARGLAARRRKSIAVPCHWCPYSRTGGEGGRNSLLLRLEEVPCTHKFET